MVERELRPAFFTLRQDSAFAQFLRNETAPLWYVAQFSGIVETFPILRATTDFSVLFLENDFFDNCNDFSRKKFLFLAYRQNIPVYIVNNPNKDKSNKTSATQDDAQNNTKTKKIDSRLNVDLLDVDTIRAALRDAEEAHAEMMQAKQTRIGDVEEIASDIIAGAYSEDGDVYADELVHIMAERSERAHKKSDVIGPSHEGDVTGIAHINPTKKDIQRALAAVDFDYYKKVIPDYLDFISCLPNQAEFCRLVRHRLEAHPEKNYTIAVWDIERFKIYNTMFTQAEGDYLLFKMGFMMRELQATNNNIYSRFYADCFVELVEDENFAPEESIKKATSLLNEINPSFEFIVHMGLYRIEDKSLDVTLMCNHALVALRSTKNDFLHRYAYFDEEMREGLVKQQTIYNEMLTALCQRQFVVFFQPQYDYITGKMCGAEALVRWKHPTRGMIPPNEFIPLFEKNGFITRLDMYIWEEVCACIKRWKNDNTPIVPISINISRRDVLLPDFCDIIERLIKDYDVAPELLHLEITESAYMDNPTRLVDIVERLRSDGFCVEIDDFGAGFSSLSSLKNLNVDVVKIDMSLVSDALRIQKAGDILSYVIRMAHWINMTVIAEGIETREHAEFLKSLGCMYMQGYYFARPMPLAEFESLLTHDNIVKTSKEAIISNAISNVLKKTDGPSILFDNYFGSAVILAWYGGANIDIVRVNDQFYDELGISREVLPVHKFRIAEKIIPSHRPRVYEALTKAKELCAEQKIDICIDLVVTAKQQAWITCKLRYISTSNDGAVYFVTINNITNQRMMYQELQTQRRTIDALYKNSPYGFLQYEVQNGSAQIISYNDTFWHLQGFDTEEQFLRTVNNLRRGEVLEEASPSGMLQRVFDHAIQGDVTTYEEHLLNFDGERSWLSVQTSAVRTSPGKELYQCVLADISSQKKDTNLKVRKMLACAYDDVYEVRPKENVLILRSSKYKRSLRVHVEYELARAVDLYAKEIVFPEDVNLFKQFISVQNVSEKSTVSTIEYRITTKEGYNSWVNASAVYIDDDAFFFCNRDVTKEKGTPIKTPLKKDTVEKLLKLYTANTGADTSIFASETFATSSEFSILKMLEGNITKVTVARVLAYIGKKLRVSRAHLLEYDEATGHFYVLGEWCNVGIPSCAGVLKNLQSDKILPLFDHDGFMVANNPQQVPAYYKQVREQDAIDAMLQCIGQVRYSPVMMLSVEIFNESHIWSTAEKLTLFNAARLILLSFAPHRIEKNYNNAAKMAQLAYAAWLRGGTKVMRSDLFNRFAISNLSRDEIFGTENNKLANVVHPQDSVAIANFLNSITIGTSSSTIVRARLVDNSYRFVNINCFVTRNAKGEIIQAHMLLHDFENVVRLRKDIENIRDSLDEILNTIPSGVVVYEVHGDDLYPIFANEQFCVVIGEQYKDYQLRIANHLAESDAFVKELFPNDARKTLRAKQRIMISPVKFTRRDGKHLWAHICAQLTKNDGAISLLYVIIEDISETVARERKQLWQSERYRIICEASNVMTFDYTPNEDTMTLSLVRDGKERTEEVYENYLALFKTKTFIIDTASQQAFELLLQKMLLQPTSATFDYQADYFFTGKPKWYRVRMVSLATLDKNGNEAESDAKVNRIVGQIEDVNDLFLENEQLNHLAEHDGLTDVKNKITGEEQIARILRERPEHRTDALLFMDLDDFKGINDTFGHTEGDRILKEFSAILKSLFRGSDIISRVGGDEFIVYMPSIGDIELAERRVKEVQRRTYALRAGGERPVGCSIGIAEIGEGETELRAVLERADKALYAAKKTKHLRKF